MCFDEKRNEIVYEDPTLFEALRESRTSDYAQRQADKARMEKLISPILSEHHRNRIRLLLKLYQVINTLNKNSAAYSDIPTNNGGASWAASVLSS